MPRDDDLRHLHGKLRTYEERLAMLRALLKMYTSEHTLASVEEKLMREIENLEYCLLRDRINHGKPE